mgnify:CR=1 FL=1
MHIGVMRTRLVGLTLAALLPALVLAGCSGSEEPEAEPSASPSVTESATEEPSATPSIDVPDGVELTTQGSALELGDTATVAYEVDQSTVGVLAITVTGRAIRGLLE